MPNSLSSLDPTKISQILPEKTPQFVSQQVMNWIFQPNCDSYEKMSNISKKNREILHKDVPFTSLKCIKHQTSTDGTKKFLFAVHSGEQIETVWIPKNKRYTVCLSSQVGCALGCRFCASGLNGLKRHCSYEEIVDQVRWLVQNENLPITHLVYMGIGEPLHNYENVAQSIRYLNQNFKISSRRITVSTSGIAPKIIQMAQDFPQVNLALSLHSADEETRLKIMPITQKYPLADLLKALKTWTSTTRRKCTLEYILLHNVNITLSHAQKLVEFAKKIPCRINTIPFNDFGLVPFETPKEDKISDFIMYLKKQGLQVTYRISRGKDISAACGQLKLTQSPPDPS